MFATGVTVLTTQIDEQVHGMTANAFMSVSLRPPLVLVSIDRRARMAAMMHEGRGFGVSVLGARQGGLSDRFAGRLADDLPEPTFEVVHGTPLVEGALAHLVARVGRSYWGGDHSLFLAEVEFARYGEGRPLLFHGGRYERLVEDPRVFSVLPPSSSTRSSRSASGGCTPTASRSCGSVSPGKRSSSSSTASPRRTTGTVGDAGSGRADRRDRGARPGWRDGSQTSTRTVRSRAWPSPVTRCSARSRPTREPRSPSSRCLRHASARRPERQSSRTAAPRATASDSPSRARRPGRTTRRARGRRVGGSAST